MSCPRILDCGQELRLIILTIKIRYGEHICKKGHVNTRITTFHKKVSELQKEDSLRHGSLNFQVGWSIALKKMLHIVCVAISLGPIMESKGGARHLSLRDSTVGTRKKRSHLILEVLLVL